MHTNGKNSGTSDDAGGDRSGKPAESSTDLNRQNTADIKLDDSAQQMIGQQLKAIYGEIVEQPIPDHFLKLLDELERKEQG